MIESIKIENEIVTIIDQTLLPQKEKYIVIKDYQSMIEAIKKLRIRGAPAIGVAGSAGCYLAAKKLSSSCELKIAMDAIEAARPTAVNLSFAIDKLRPLVDANEFNKLEVIFLEKTMELMKYEKNASIKMGENGCEIISTKRPLNILTHCNTGSLATYGEGTALALIRALAKKTKVHVFVDETRPLLQGSRLTAWELMKSGIDATLISDNMAAHIMKTNKIDCIITGADRITKNGDSANKIGTFNLSILAKYFNIPFYIVAPESTIDRKLETGDQIAIEQRNANEVRFFQGKQSAPIDVNVANPAFDVTPAENITAIVTDKQVYQAPYLL